MLPLGLTQEALTAAETEKQPDSLASLTRLRDRFGGDLAAAAATQIVLRRRAVAKFGPAAGTMYFTREGLEQATRPEVAAHRAARFAVAGVRRIVDLGCGIGSDARAFLAAGLEVVAVETDPATATVARANLTGRAEVLVGDVAALWPRLRAPGVAAFCDPARRTARGRSWRVEDFSPDWAFVTGLLDGSQPAGVKLGPGLPYGLIPDGVSAEWVSSAGDLVETALWRLPGERAGRSATSLPARARLVVPAREPALPVSAPQDYLYEPDPAAIRAGAVPVLATDLGLARLAPGIAYLTGEERVDSPWLTGFAVAEVLPYAERALRAWVRQHEVGTLEIKKRGLEVDPAALRRRLRPVGPRSATLVLSPTVAGARALVVQRLPRPG